MQSSLALPFVLLALGCSPVHPAAEEPLDLPGAFSQAAVEHEVPEDLLLGWAWSASRFDARDGLSNEVGGVGLFHMVPGGVGGPDLDEAALVIDARADSVAALPTLQVQAMAALLRAEANWWGSVEGREIHRVEDWFPVVARLAGTEDTALQAAHARAVFRPLEGGLDFTTRDGDAFFVEGRELDLPAPLLVPASGSTDSALAVRFAAAHANNYTAGSRAVGAVDRIVIHTVQGSYVGAVSWFQNRSARASAHYTIRSSDGEVTQSVRERDIAWHAGHRGTNERAIGIEHEGYIDRPDLWYTDALYRSSAALVRDIALRHGIPIDREHVIAHYEVPGCSSGRGGGASCHTDPGTGWDWDRLISLARAGDTGTGTDTGTDTGGSTAPSAATGDLTGFVRAERVSDGAPIVGAQVTLSTGQSTTTGADGRYTFTGLPAGVVQVSAAATGYGASAAEKLVQSDMLNWQSIALSPSSAGAATVPGAPTALNPRDWATDTGGDTTLTWSPSGAAASGYEVQIHWWDGAAWQPYYTYTTTTPTRTFWPVVEAPFAWRVRGQSSAGIGAWSAWAYFTFAG